MDHTPGSSRRAPKLLAAALMLLGSLVLAPAAPRIAAAPAQVSTDGPEWFEGSVDDFYVVPDPLPHGEPGELIRIQEVSEDATHKTVRIMYHSRDQFDVDRAVTGKMTYPTAAPPADGWPVLSIANGTVGLASHCALSRSGGSVWRWNQPVVAVASDYIGLGPVGELHPYLSRGAEGHSVIDAVRAAGNLPDAGAGSRWLTLGGSQGGHGAQSAHELAPVHAPELDHLGTVSMAPAAMFMDNYGPLDVIVTRVVEAMGVMGADANHPDINASDYLSPEAMEVMKVVETGCLPEIITAMLQTPFDTFYKVDPKTAEPARSWLMGSDVGRYRTDSPVLLVQGTADTTVFPARTRDLFARMCSTGQVTEYVEYQGAGHGNIGSIAGPDIDAWLGDRIAGLPATSNCPISDAPPRVIPGVGSVLEGPAGVTTNLDVPVTLSASSLEEVTVRWGAGFPLGQHRAHAVPGVHVDRVEGTVTFAPGQTEAHVSIPVHGNDIDEPDRLVVVSFGSPTNASMGGFWGLGFGIIRDDD